MSADTEQETYLDMTRRYFPDCEESHAHFILWNLTCYPFGRPWEVERHIAEAAIAQRYDLFSCEFCGKLMERDHRDVAMHERGGCITRRKRAKDATPPTHREGGV